MISDFRLILPLIYHDFHDFSRILEFFIFNLNFILVFQFLPGTLRCTRQAYNLSLSTPLHGSIMSNEKAIVYAEDMTDEMMNEAIKTAKNAFQSSSNRVSGGPYKETAAQIRGHFDKQYGPHWNCIVGRSFGSYVTHEIKTYIYFSVKAHVAVLLWKT